MVNKNEADRGALIVVILIIIFLAIAWSWGSSDNNEEQKDCVDNCLFDMKDCMSDRIVFDKNINGWYSEDDYDDCLNDLEMCSNDCNPD